MECPICKGCHGMYIEEGDCTNQLVNKLQSIVDNLPQTADGVSVIPLVSPVWVCHDGQYWDGWIVIDDDDVFWGRFMVDAPLKSNRHHYYIEHAMYRCYSTKQAAEEAKEGKNDG